MAEKRVFSATRGHFFYLLVSLFLLLLLHPFFAGAVLGRIVFLGCFSAVLFAALYAVSENRRVFTLAVAIAIPVLAGRWLGFFLESGFLALMVQSGTALFFAFTLAILLSHVLKDEEVTGDKINGAICVYLLIGLTWGLLFSVIEAIRPGSFQMAQAPDGGTEEKLSLFVYYSFVTMTTVGYGDVLPATPVARSLSIVEAVIGQIYLATLIARLVGLHIVHSLKKGSR
ncbi:MAG: potassium channel family protein [Candidatus Methylomirabilales bacterium]